MLLLFLHKISVLFQRYCVKLYPISGLSARIMAFFQALSAFGYLYIRRDIVAGFSADNPLGAHARIHTLEFAHIDKHPV